MLQSIRPSKTGQLSDKIIKNQHRVNKTMEMLIEKKKLESAGVCLQAYLSAWAILQAYLSAWAMIHVTK